jgi:CBS domain-containing protein
MKVGSLCRHEVASVPMSASIYQVATLMCQQRVGSVIVTDRSGARSHVLGIITDRDIVLAQLERTASFAEINVSDVMTTCPLLIHEDEDVTQATRRLRNAGVRRAPVVNAAGELVGVISVDDLFSQVAKDIRNLAGIVDRQRRN